MIFYCLVGMKQERKKMGLKRGYPLIVLNHFSWGGVFHFGPKIIKIKITKLMSTLSSFYFYKVNGIIFLL